MDFMHGFIVFCRIGNNLTPVYKDLRELTGKLHAPAELPLTNRGMLWTPWLDLYHLLHAINVCTCIYADLGQGLNMIHVSNWKGTKVYRFFGTRCCVSTWFGKAKQVRSNSPCVCACTYTRTRETKRERQRASSDLIKSMWVGWGSSKYQEIGQRLDLIFSFLLFSLMICSVWLIKSELLELTVHTT